MTSVLSVSGLTKLYLIPAGVVHAVEDVAFEIEKGHSVAVVGESGCGKSTLAMSILQLIKPTRGEIRLNGTNLVTASKRDLRVLRQQIGVVFQDPTSSLNPRLKVAENVGEPLRVHRGLRGAELRDRVREVLDQVGMPPDAMDRFPHQFSGGQRQRIAIARALTLNPELIILDEPTSALDVSVQAQVLNLLQDLKEQRGISYLYISHSLATVEYLADLLIVMYLGRIVESGDADRIFASPKHPYTRLLIDSAPSLDPNARRLTRPPEGEIPSPINRPAECPFAARCDRASDQCRSANPELHITEQDHKVACFHPI